MRLGLQGAGKERGGIRGVPALRPNQAQSVERLGVLRTQSQGLTEAPLRPGRVAQAQLGHPEFDQGLDPIAAAQGAGGQLGPGRLEVVLLQPQAAQIVVRLGQVPVALEGVLVGPMGLLGLARVMAGQTQVIPGDSVGLEQCRGRGGFQLLDRLLGAALFEEPFALQQRARPRRRATGQQ